MKLFFCLFIATICLTGISIAKIKLPSLISDNMILQQTSSVKIWGNSDNGNEVVITPSWNNKKYLARTDRNGDWMTTIETPNAGGPYTLKISDKNSSVVLHNILIGEVWFCSGQSNMDMPLSGYMGQPIDNALHTVTYAKKTDNIRFFKVERNYNNKAEEFCGGKWLEATPTTVADCSATAYFFAKKLQASLDVPVAIIVSSWGGSHIETWMDQTTLQNQFPEVSLEVLKKDIKEVKNPRPQPTLLFNGMVHPAKNYTIKGFLWYQGESNIQNYDLYRKLFPAMVESWRNLWEIPNAPFYYVQIAPYNYSHPDSLEAAHMRQVQSECLEIIPNSGMVVTADIGNPTCIHPSQKDVVGNRLALQALGQTYDKHGTPFNGPMYKSAKVINQKLILLFDNASRGLHNDGLLNGFEVADEDKKFHTANAVLTNNTTEIELTCEEVKNVAYVRYAYKNYGAVNVFNNWGLPLNPFFKRIE